MQQHNRNSPPQLRPLALAIGRTLGGLWFLLLIAVALTSCAHGTQRTPDAYQPNLSIPAGQLATAPTELPELSSADEVEILRNHVASARMFHAVSLQLNSLICTLSRAVGITINGDAPKPGAACAAVDRVANGRP